jgi:hypothetical protein
MRSESIRRSDDVRRGDCGAATRPDPVSQKRLGERGSSPSEVDRTLRAMPERPIVPCVLCGQLNAPPPTRISARRPCGFCERFVYRPPSADGLTVAAGEQIFMPGGGLSISLDREASGRLMRPGVAWFVREAFFAHRPDESEGIEVTLERYRDSGLKILEESDLLHDVDWEDPIAPDQVWSLVKHKDELKERWALPLCQAAHQALEALERETRKPLR